MARAVRSDSRVDTALLAVCAILALFTLVLPTTARDSVAAVLRRTVLSPLLSLQEQAERARGAFLERDKVNARIDSLAMRGARVPQLVDENERLRRLLGLAHQLQWGFLPAEALHATTGASNDEDVVLLTVGAEAGVRPRAPVVAPDGLVGVVTSTDPKTSQAILWTHADFRVSAMAADGSAFGIVQPHRGPEPDRYMLEMRGVAFRDALKNGTLITSSGLGGVFPRGIPIGVVVGEIRTLEGWARTYLLRPSVRPQDIAHVMVLTADRVSSDVSTVWQSASSVDSAQRRIVAAGDSLDRQEAEVRAARQRMLDSAAAMLSGVNVAPNVTASDSLRARLKVSGLKRDSVRRDSVKRPPP
ncbi:MAG: rod shape-determining protein MreC [Gemmatimonadaceae bacterium]